MSSSISKVHGSSQASESTFRSRAPATPGPSRQRNLSEESSLSWSTASAGRLSGSNPQLQPLLSSNKSLSLTHSRSTSLGPNGSLRGPGTPAYSAGRTAANGRLSRAASSIGASEGHQVICAVSEARGVAPSVGVAFINVSTGKAILSQICDNQSYVKTMHKLTVFEPSRVLIVSTACPPNPKSSLHATIEEELPTAQIFPLDRKYWSETGGLEYIQELAFKADVEAIKVAIQGNFYATCAFSAVC